MIGETITHYRILQQIGEGGMGVVYVAEDTRLGRRVAIKIPSSHEQEFRARFLREARSISALSHPHIATIHDYGEMPDGRPFIVMELIKGGDLSGLLRGGTLTLSRAIEIIEGVADALDEAHRHGIVHRDIKPSNVMLNERGEVKVLDFGLAKQMEDEPHLHETQRASDTQPLARTQSGTVIGTPLYFSPEQATNAVVDGRSDLFSLGALLYECIAGQPAFRGSTLIEIGGQVLHVNPPPPSKFNPRVPPELDRVTLKTLAKKPEERYQSAAELKADLHAARSKMQTDGGLVPTTGMILPAQTTLPVSVWKTLSTKLRTGGRGSRAVVRVLVLVALVAVALAAFAYFRRDTRTINSVAVMPFANVGGDPNVEYLTDGITESLINSLSQLLPMKVMSRNSVFRYKGRDIEPRKIGDDLGVGAVLTGRVVERGQELTVSVELTDAADNTHIWGKQYNRRMNDILSVQDEIAREVAEHLRSKLRLREAEQSRPLPTPKRYTENTEAYQAYLRGRYFWNRRSQEGFEKAIENFEQAIRIDPNYALAYAGLADCYALQSDYSLVPPIEAMPKAKQAAERAISIDDTLAEAYTSLAFVQMAYDWKWADAEQSFQRAIKLNPNYATAHQWYASCLVQMNRTDEALAEIQHAQELDPLSLIINANRGLYLYYAKRYEEAQRQLTRTLEVDRTFGVAHLYLGYVYLQMPGHTAQAIAEFQESIKNNRDGPEAQAALGYAYAVAGKPDKAREVLGSLTEMKPGSYVSPYFVAIVYVGLGDKDAAFAWLEQAYKQRQPGIVLMRIDPRFDSLRSDPRFAEVLRHISPE